MANTVTTLNYANTFGDWLVATDSLINENNILATGDYTKPSGTLYLNETTQNSLQANGNIVVQKQLLVQGTGSSATIQNNLTVGGQVYFTNTTLGLTHTGQANLNGLVLVQGSGIGIQVSNSAYVGGNTTIRYNTITNNLQANTSVNTGVLSVQTASYTNTLQANSSVNTGILSVATVAYTNYLEANTSVNTSVASIVNTTYTKDLQANTSITTGTVTANTLVTAANIISSGAISAAGNAIASRLLANTDVQTPTISVTGTAQINTVVANTVIQAPNVISSGAMSAAGTVTANRFVANNGIQTPNLISSGAISAGGTIVGDILKANTTIDGNSAVGFFNSIQTIGQISVGGNFVINGATVYSTNTFTLSANSSVGQISYFNVNRGSSGANASIRWNETQKYFDILNVSNNTYYRLLTSDLFNDTGTNTSTTLVATANSVNAVSINTASAATYANGAFIQANAAFNAANTADTKAVNSGTYANGAFTMANAAFSRANTSSNTFVGTTGSASPSSGVVSFTSNNGVTVVATTANNLAISTSQDLRTTASPTFVGGTFSAPVIGVTEPVATSNTAYATTAYVNAKANSGATFTASVTGNSGTATKLQTARTINGTSFDGSTNISFNTDSVAEGSSNLYFTTARARSAVSATGSLSYNSSTGVFSYTQGNTDTVTEGTTNLYFTNARARGAISVSGSLSYNSTTGVISYTTPSTSGITEGTNLYYTDARARAAISVSGSLSYNSTTGVMSYTTPSTSGITEGTNLYYTDARARAAHSGGTGVTYNSSTGAISIGQDIGTSSNVQHFSLGIGVSASASAGDIRATGDITAFYSSDIRFKENVKEIENALDIVTTIGGKTFDWKDDYINTHGGEDGYFLRKSDFGVIAQDVQSVFPIATRTKSDGSLAVDYEKLCVLAFQAIKELKAEIDELKKK
jgi:hypothetical protein